MGAEYLDNNNLIKLSNINGWHLFINQLMNYLEKNNTKNKEHRIKNLKINLKSLKRMN
jgi:hypothetical protein